jgi:hypothetical protein
VRATDVRKAAQLALPGLYDNCGYELAKKRLEGEDKAAVTMALPLLEKAREVRAAFAPACPAGGSTWLTRMRMYDRGSKAAAATAAAAARPPAASSTTAPATAVSEPAVSRAPASGSLSANAAARYVASGRVGLQQPLCLICVGVMWAIGLLGLRLCQYLRLRLRLYLRL